MVPKPNLPPPPLDTTKKLNPHGKIFVQEAISTILYYACAVSFTLHVTLGTQGTQQASPTKSTSARITHLLNYVIMHPNATVRYYAIGMILNVHSDAIYLSENGLQSRAGGFFF